MPELNPSLLKGEGRKNAQFQIERQHVRKGCSAYNEHTRTRSTAQAGGAEHPRSGPQASTEPGTEVAGLGCKMLQGLWQLQNQLLRVEHVCYRYELQTFLGKKKKPNPPHSLAMSVGGRRKHQVGLRKSGPSPIAVNYYCSRTDTSPLSRLASLC